MKRFFTWTVALAVGVGLVLYVFAGAAGSLTQYGPSLRVGSSLESRMPPGLTPAQREAELKILPPELHCTITLQTVTAGPGTKLSDCINNDDNIPHPVSHWGPQAAGLPKTYLDGKPTMVCPLWGGQGSSPFAVVPEGTKLCPTPSWMTPLSPDAVKGAFTAP